MLIFFFTRLLLHAKFQHQSSATNNINFFSFQDRASEPSSPNEAVNPLDAAVKARRKDKDEEKETGGT